MEASKSCSMRRAGPNSSFRRRSAATPQNRWTPSGWGRAIGVIYLPATERQSHYYNVRPADQFDAMIHIDKTRALEPLEVTSNWSVGETPETYPTGL